MFQSLLSEKCCEVLVNTYVEALPKTCYIFSFWILLFKGGGVGGKGV